MKTEAYMKNDVRKIVKAIFKLRDDVIQLESSKVADAYRAHLMGLEEEIAQRFEKFGNELNPPKNHYEIEYQIQGFYSGGWEEITCEDTRYQAIQRLKEYRENERGVSFKLVIKRIKKPSLVS